MTAVSVANKVVKITWLKILSSVILNYLFVMILLNEISLFIESRSENMLKLILFTIFIQFICLIALYKNMEKISAFLSKRMD